MSMRGCVQCYGFLFFFFFFKQETAYEISWCWSSDVCSSDLKGFDAIRAFVKNLTPALKLSMAALETLAVIAYKQPITAPEILEIRGVQGAGVLKTLLDRKLIAAAGRKRAAAFPEDDARR